MRPFIKRILSLSVVIIFLAGCSKKDDTPPAVPKDGIGHADYITVNAYVNIPTGIYINFIDQDGKSAYAHLLPATSPDANATVTLSSSDFSSASSVFKVSASSAEFLEMKPLQNNATITIALDNPVTSVAGQSYKSLTINIIDEVNIEVDSQAIGLQMTTATEASNGFPAAKAYLKTLLTKTPGRYRISFH